MVRLSLFLVLFNILSLTWAFASSNEPVHTKTSSARALYKQQCDDVGGSVNGFCMCAGKEDLITLAATVVNVAKDISKAKQSSFLMINPFTQSCNDKAVDLNLSFQRLQQIHKITLTTVQNTELQEKIFLMDELDLFDPDAFSNYMTNGKFKKNLLKKIKKIRTKQQEIMKSGIAGSARTMAQEKAKFVAIGAIEEFTDINIKSTLNMTNQIKTFITASLQQSATGSLTGSLKEMGAKFLKTTAKSLGKGFVAGVIMTAGLETISYVTGLDVTVFDPFQVFLPTPAGDGTISGNLNKNVSLTLYPEFQNSLDMGFYTNPEYFSGKLVMMAMVTESLAQDQSMFSFLSE